MIWVYVVVTVVLVVVIALVTIGRETFTLRTTARPAVFDMEEAVYFIAERLPEEVAGRLTHDDVRWVLLTDVELLEEAGANEDSDLSPEVFDEDASVAAIIGRAEAEKRELDDADVVAVLDGRLGYLQAIGAIGPEVGEV